MVSAVYTSSPDNPDVSETGSKELTSSPESVDLVRSQSELQAGVSWVMAYQFEQTCFLCLVRVRKLRRPMLILHLFTAMFLVVPLL